MKLVDIKATLPKVSADRLATIAKVAGVSQNSVVRVALALIILQAERGQK